MANPPDPEVRPNNREVENEEGRTPARPGQPQRPATEPPGSRGSSQSPKTLTDPGTGAPHEGDQVPNAGPIDETLKK